VVVALQVVVLLGGAHIVVANVGFALVTVEGNHLVVHANQIEVVARLGGHAVLSRIGCRIVTDWEIGVALLVGGRQA
jgi:hypothetical protein